MGHAAFPPLPLDAWEDSKITLHLWMQIVGKIKLDLMPSKNHWWHITLHVFTKGVTTGSIPHQKGIFQCDFNFIDHIFEISSSWGEYSSFPLEDGLSVKQFHQKLFQSLNQLGINCTIKGIPYDHPCKEPFDECETHHRYQKTYIQQFWHALVSIDQVFQTFSGKFYGKVSPSQIFWHHMDLAVTRFSGKKVPPFSGGTAADQEAYSHEVISAGFWAGDEEVRAAAFYAYVYPSPEGLDQMPLLPNKAHWIDSNGSPMAMLMYDDLIQSDDPRQDLLNFLESTYKAGAQCAQWSSELIRQA